MRLMKMFGLAAIAAVASMAFIGASSASANNLSVVACKKPTLTCAVGDQYELNLTLLGTATNPFLKTNIGTVKCNTSHAEAVLLNHLATTIVGHIKLLNFTGNCNLNGTACTVNVLTVGLVNGTRLGPLTANVKSTGGTKALVQCGAFIHCVYGGEPTLIATSTTETEAATLTATAAKLTQLEGFLCPETSEWTAKYVLSVPGTPIYIES